MIKGVIFDLDGTILKSVDLRVKEWKHAFQIFDIRVEEDELRPLIGLPGKNLAGRYHDHPEEIEKAEEEFFAKHLSDAQLFPDVEETIGDLKESGVRVVLVTSSRRSLVRKLNLPFQRVITIDDVTNGKPDTEAYLKALAFMGIDAPELVVIGDAESDLVPAKKLGAISVMVLHGRNKKSHYADYYMEEIGDIKVLIEQVNSLKSSA